MLLSFYFGTASMIADSPEKIFRRSRQVFGINFPQEFRDIAGDAEPYAKVPIFIAAL
jgi:hypothetical protein